MTYNRDMQEDKERCSTASTLSKPRSMCLPKWCQPWTCVLTVPRHLPATPMLLAIDLY